LQEKQKQTKAIITVDEEPYSTQVQTQAQESQGQETPIRKVSFSFKFLLLNKS